MNNQTTTPAPAQTPGKPEFPSIEEQKAHWLSLKTKPCPACGCPYPNDHTDECPFYGTDYTKILAERDALLIMLEHWGYNKEQILKKAVEDFAP